MKVILGELSPQVTLPAVGEVFALKLDVLDTFGFRLG